MNHLRNSFNLAYGSFRTVVALQGFVLAMYSASFTDSLWQGFWPGLGTFALFVAGGAIFGFLPMALVFTPLYALLCAKGLANWLSSMLLGLSIAGVLCLHPALRLLMPLWLLDSALIALLTHWTYRRQLKDGYEQTPLWH
ncbi:hypothetical protein J2Y88_002103 [Pseudomonas chlororaphis]|uniref:hypothetical protein n=1 Tax=Pseudomonas chlororaphis TaxID=587753 RepID=UPI0020A0981F|nr:hypothetical protein [Pseudomonas chlororaphis]MCP1479792.1 hypothetical protein [Pseudomonas chlororaphis]MCP1593856.1 hypothetical protein [Pseudomonas chlororaphis]